VVSDIVDTLAMMELAAAGEMVVVLGGTELLLEPELAPEFVPLLAPPAVGLINSAMSSV
jgi:hypothetical protein